MPEDETFLSIMAHCALLSMDAGKSAEAMGLIFGFAEGVFMVAMAPASEESRISAVERNRRKLLRQLKHLAEGGGE